MSHSFTQFHNDKIVQRCFPFHFTSLPQKNYSFPAPHEKKIKIPKEFIGK